MTSAAFLMAVLLNWQEMPMESIAAAHVKSCQQHIVSITGKPLAADIDTVVVQYLKLTSTVAFTRGTLGEIGELDENYQQFFVCTISNEHAELVSLYETKVKMHYQKDTPLSSEYLEHYVLNDEAFFNLLRFSRDSEEFIYQEKVKYNNFQLYKYYEALEDSLDLFVEPSVKPEYAVSKALLGTWKLQNDSANDSCIQSISFSVHGYFAIGNECDDLPDSQASFHESEVLRESGSWSVDNQTLLLQRQRIYRETFLAPRPKNVKFTYELTNYGNDLTLGTREGNELILKKIEDLR